VTESPNQMVISDPSDHPIVDSRGNAWRITQSGHVSANGVLDEDSSDVMQLAYVNQMMWRQTKDLLWRSKSHPGDDWWPRDGTSRSPMSGASARELEEIESAVAQVLSMVKALKADFDAFKAQPGGSQAPVLAAIAALKADLDAGVLTLPAQVLAQITAGFDAMETSLAAGYQTLITDIGAIFASAQLTAATNQAALIALLNEILAAVQTQSKPTRIVLDIANATHVPQPVPSRNGP
jgi:hypothetical protein